MTHNLVILTFSFYWDTAFKKIKNLGKWNKEKWGRGRHRDERERDTEEIEREWRRLKKKSFNRHGIILLINKKILPILQIDFANNLRLFFEF